MMRDCRALITAALLCVIFSAGEFSIAEAALTDSAGIRMLEEIQTVITELAEQAKPSVVNLFPIVGTGRPRESGGDRQIGRAHV